MTEYAHPVTGEVLETEEDFSAAIRAMDEAMSPSRNAFYALIRERSERFPATFPGSRRARTDTQEKVARCPRCGGRLEIDEGGA